MSCITLHASMKAGPGKFAHKKWYIAITKLPGTIEPKLPAPHTSPQPPAELTFFVSMCGAQLTDGRKDSLLNKVIYPCSFIIAGTFPWYVGPSPSGPAVTQSHKYCTVCYKYIHTGTYSEIPPFFP